MISSRERRPKRLLILATLLLLGGDVEWARFRPHPVAQPTRSRGEIAVGGLKSIPVDSAARPSGRLLPDHIAPASDAELGATLAAVEPAVRAMPDDERRAEYLQRVLREAVKLSPLKCANWAAGLADSKFRDIGVGYVLVMWAQSDAASALQWAVEHPRAENDATRLFAAFEGFADQDPLGALHWMQRPELSTDADELSRIAIFHAKSGGRLADATAELEKLPEGNLRDLLTRQAVAVWAKDSPVDAANWLASNATESGFRAGMGALVQTVVDRDPAFAAGLTQQFRDSQIREQYLADVVYLWARRDLGAAAAWLRAQPPGQQLDAAISRMAEATIKFDPVEAAAWVAAINDSSKREELRKRLHAGE